MTSLHVFRDFILLYRQWRPSVKRWVSLIAKESFLRKDFAASLHTMGRTLINVNDFAELLLLNMKNICFYEGSVQHQTEDRG
jgi:hypothetical protein